MPGIDEGPLPVAVGTDEDSFPVAGRVGAWDEVASPPAGLPAIPMCGFGVPVIAGEFSCIGVEVLPPIFASRETDCDDLTGAGDDRDTEVRRQVHRINPNRLWNHIDRPGERGQGVAVVDKPGR